MELATTDATRASGPQGNASLLLVDDDEHIREAVSMLLEARGYSVTECSDALEALELLQSGQRPDLIVLDLMMPRMNGWQFRVELKRNERWADIPVLALSADQSPQALAMDADGHLSKPVDQRQLIDAIERLVSGPKRLAREPQAAPAQRGESLGKLAGEIARNIEAPAAYTLTNLQLAQNMVAEVEARLSGADAFSLVGIRQLLARAQRGAERIAGLVHGTATFAALTGRDRALGRSRVLLLDSDPTQVERMRSWLQEDYEVHAVESPAAALARIEQHGLFHALLLSLVGPDFQGMELYRLLLEHAPEQASKVAFMTEGRFDERLRRFLASARRPQLHRPMRPAELRHFLKNQHRSLH